MPDRRDWSLARAKVEQEGRCRLTGEGPCQGPLAACHVVERSRDESTIVDPVDIWPGCTLHHQLYDSRRVSILHVLSQEEQAAAVRKLGIYRALKRLTSNQSTILEEPTDRPE